MYIQEGGSLMVQIIYSILINTITMVKITETRVDGRRKKMNPVLEESNELTKLISFNFSNSLSKKLIGKILILKEHLRM